MKKVLLACAALCALSVAAPAQDLPTLSQFLSSCYRESGPCQAKIRDFVRAGTQQNVICLPKDVSEREAASDILRWLRDENAHDASLLTAPFDDALFEASSKLYACAPPPPPPPPPPVPEDQPAPPDQAPQQ